MLALSLTNRTNRNRICVRVAIVNFWRPKCARGKARAGDMGACRFPMPMPLAPKSAFRHSSGRLAHPDPADVLRAGRNSPPAVRASIQKEAQARELLPPEL